MPVTPTVDSATLQCVYWDYNASAWSLSGLTLAWLRVDETGHVSAACGTLRTGDIAGVILE